MKKIVNISMILLIGLFLLTGCKNNKENEKQPNIKANTNEDVVKNQQLENFLFENTSLVYEDGTSTLQTTVTNTSNETTYLSEFIIYVKDKDGNEIITLRGFVGDKLKAGEKRTISSSCGDDLTNAASISYEVVRE